MSLLREYPDIHHARTSCCASQLYCYLTPYMKSLLHNVADNTAWQLVHHSGSQPTSKQTQTACKLVFRHVEVPFFNGFIRQGRRGPQTHVYVAFCVARKAHLLNLKCLKLAYFHSPPGSWWVEDAVHSLEETCQVPGWQTTLARNARPAELNVWFFFGDTVVLVISCWRIKRVIVFILHIINQYCLCGQILE